MTAAGTAVIAAAGADGETAPARRLTRLVRVQSSSS